MRGILVTDRHVWFTRSGWDVGETRQTGLEAVPAARARDAGGRDGPGARSRRRTPADPHGARPPSRRADPGLPDQARQAAVGVMARAVTLRVAVLGSGVLVGAAPVGAAPV